MGFFTVTPKSKLDLPLTEPGRRVQQTMLRIDPDAIAPQPPRDYIAAVLRGSGQDTTLTAGHYVPTRVRQINDTMLSLNHARMLWVSGDISPALAARIHDEVFANPRFAELSNAATPDQGVAFASMITARDLAHIRNSLAISVDNHTYTDDAVHDHAAQCVNVLNSTLDAAQPDTTVLYSCIIEKF